MLAACQSAPQCLLLAAGPHGIRSGVKPPHRVPFTPLAVERGLRQLVTPPQVVVAGGSGGVVEWGGGLLFRTALYGSREEAGDAQLEGEGRFWPKVRCPTHHHNICLPAFCLTSAWCSHVRRRQGPNIQ